MSVNKETSIPVATREATVAISTLKAIRKLVVITTSVNKETSVPGGNQGGNGGNFNIKGNQIIGGHGNVGQQGNFGQGGNQGGGRELKETVSLVF